jgi:hypothetical protein
MIHPKPAMFFKITPINPNGITVVNLGETDDVLPASVPVPLARRHSSLPPLAVTETRKSHGKYKPREERHRSLPPKTVTIVSPSTTFEASEMDGEGDADGEGDEDSSDNATVSARVSCLLITID